MTLVDELFTLHYLSLSSKAKRRVLLAARGEAMSPMARRKINRAYPDYEFMGGEII